MALIKTDESPTTVSSLPSKHILFWSFVAFGVSMGTWVVTLSELKVHLQLTVGQLGATLTVSALIALPAQFLASAAVHRWGRSVLPVAALTLAAACIAIGFLDDRWLLFLLMPVALLSMGYFVVVINASGLRREHQTGERILPTLHAGFSLGAVPGTLVTGLVLHVGTLQHAYLILAAFLAVTAFAFRNLGEGLSSDPTVARPPMFDRLLIRNRGLLVVTALSMVAYFGESAMYSWTAIYLRDELHAGVFAGSAGVAAFYAAMAAGRLGSSAVQRRIGRLDTLACAGLLIAVGMTIALSTTSASVAVTGVVITGLAFAVAVPVALSVAGSLAPGQYSGVSGFILPLHMATGLIVPLSIGSLADATTLRTALCLQIVIGVVLAIGVTVFRRNPLSLPARD